MVEIQLNTVKFKVDGIPGIFKVEPRLGSVGNGSVNYYCGNQGIHLKNDGRTIGRGGKEYP
nr:hypothetical protein [Candidatus Sigynarchaeum springense]